MPKRVITMSVLPGEPLDGTGKVCIHLFVQDEKGLIVEPHVLHQVTDDQGKSTGQVTARPTRGRLACDRKLTVRPVTKRGVTKITHRSDDPRAVTCPACIASEAYESAMLRLKTPTSQ